MASPQLENGYVRIATEIFDHLARPGINGSEYRILITIFRKTYGFNKQKDRISLTQFQKYTEMNRSQAVETIKSLVCKRILLKEGSLYKFNKNWEEWVVCKRIPSTQKHTTASMQKHTKSSMQKHTHNRQKDTITKDNTSKTTVLQGKQWNELIDLFEPINPMYQDFYKNKTERAALESLVTRLGFEKVKSTIEHLPEIIALPFAPKVTKPSELKRDLGKLIAFYNQEKLKLQSKGKAIIQA